MKRDFISFLLWLSWRHSDLVFAVEARMNRDLDRRVRRFEARCKRYARRLAAMTRRGGRLLDLADRLLEGEARRP